MSQRAVVLSSLVGLISLAVGLGIGVFVTSVGLDDRVEREDYDALNGRYHDAMKELQKLKIEKARATRNWRKLLVASKRKAASARAEVEEAENPVAANSESEGATYDFETLREMLKAGKFSLDGIITREGIEKTLEKNGRDPEFLVAAALLSGDVESALAYLEEALEKNPASPSALLAFLSALVRSGETGELSVAVIEDLMAADPTNSLANYYAAYLALEGEDVPTAMTEIRKAASKTHLNDYGARRLPTVEAFYRDAGCSRSVAKILAMTGMTFEYLAPLRDLARATVEESTRYHDAGDLDEALSVARSGAQIGNRLSTSGRYLVHDLVGIAIEGQALERERAIYEARGNRSQLEEIDRRLQNNARRKEEAKRVSEVFLEAILQLSESEVEQYFSRLVTEGEAAVARELPGVREALSRGEE